MSFAGVYPHYVAKAEKKGRRRDDVDEVVRWPTEHQRAIRIRGRLSLFKK